MPEWHKLVGETTELDASEATHIGPQCGDVTAHGLRYRSASKTH